MAWIKRNLYFVIGSVIALALMGLAGYYLYSQWSVNNQIAASLADDYEKLRRFNTQTPHPGSGQVDNIKLAQEQRAQLREYLKKPGRYFERIAPIPDQPKITDQDFASALSHTVDELQKEATNASVTLPPNYGFSFDAERPKVQFAQASLAPLANQLGEVKAISEILFAAKINSLDNLRRERVATEDGSGPQTDYIPDRSVTNELAILTPYELTFRGFSSELAAVLSGFASSTNGFIVKTINVEPAQAGTEAPGTPYAQYTPTAVAAPRYGTESAADMYRQRYGINPGGPAPGTPGAYANRYGTSGGAGQNLGGIQLRPLQSGGQQAYTPPVRPAVSSGVAARPGGGALPTLLDEKPLKITMSLVLVKLLPPK